MALQILGLRQIRVVVHPRADQEERRLELVGVEEVEQPRRILARAVVVRDAPRELVRALGDVGVAGASSAGPPAAGGVGRLLGARRAVAVDGFGEVGDVCVLDLIEPLLDFLCA